MGLTHVAHLSPSSTSDDLRQLFQRIIPSAAGGPSPFATVEHWLLGLIRARGTLSLYAIPLFLWFSTRLFASARSALTLVYDVPRRPGQHFVLGYVAGKLRDAMMVLLTLALLVANALLTTGLGLFDDPTRGVSFFASRPGYLVREFVAFAFSVSLFYVVYRHASPRRLPRRAAFAGSVFTAMLFEVAKRLFGWYLHNLAVVNRFSTDANIGAVILFVVWLYYTALVFLIGAVVAETWDLRGRQRSAGAARSTPASVG